MQNEDTDTLPGCSICRNDPPTNAVKLNCGHIFCFLCIKSASETTGTCALCRTEIGLEFNFQEHEVLGALQVPTAAEDGSYWFYEGFRGWWLYDKDTNQAIENAWRSGAPSLERFLAGTVYVIDLRNMCQRALDGYGKSRKICRATLEMDNILGMSGLRSEELNSSIDMMRQADRDYQLQLQQRTGIRS